MSANNASAAAAASPFAPAGIVFHPVSPALITARLIFNLGSHLLGLIIFAGLGLGFTPWFYIGSGICFIACLCDIWIIPRQVHAMGYALAQEHLLWRKGILFKRISVVPYGRMQFVETSQGPIGRCLKIAEVKLRTASAATDATINGLPLAQAEHLRKILSERGEQRLAGL